MPKSHHLIAFVFAFLTLTFLLSVFRVLDEQQRAVLGACKSDCATLLP